MVGKEVVVVVPVALGGDMVVMDCRWTTHDGGVSAAAENEAEDGNA